MEQDEALGPVQVGFFGGIAVVLGADARAHLVKQLGLLDDRCAVV
jgi:hypothetical protein